MRSVKTILAGIVLLVLGVGAGYCTTVTGTLKVNGTPFTGSMTYQLSYPGSTGTYLNFPAPSAPIPINNGTFASLAIDGNDIQLPRGTCYAFKFYDPFGRMVTRLNYVITGSSYDLGAAVPTPVLTNNVNFLDLLGLRNVSILNLTVNNSLQFGSGTIVGSSGVQNAENVMGIYFAQAFNIQNPSSTTCGLQEAETAMPSAGGILIAQPGTCNMTGTFTINKPLTLMGMGGGGYADSSTFSTFLSPTTLNETGTGILVQVSPAAGATLSGVTLTDISLTGASGSSDLLSLGNASSTTAILRNVTLERVLMHSGQGNGISVVGNLAGLHIRNSLITGNTGSGIAITASTGYSVTGVELGPKTSASRNGVDGLTLSGIAAKDVKATDFTASNNVGRGVNVGSGATASTFTAYQSTFTSNTAGNILLAGGSGHVVEASTIASSAAHGVDITGAAIANTQTASFKDNIFIPANTTYDIDNASTAYVILYPQVTQNAVLNGSFATVNTSGTFTSGPGWVKDPTGQIVEHGSITVSNTGATVTTSTISFPLTFPTSVDSLILTAGNAPSGGGTDALTYYYTSLSTSGAGVTVRCPVNIGGSGCSSIGSSMPISWIAIGK